MRWLGIYVRIPLTVKNYNEARAVERRFAARGETDEEISVF
jgi:hypothetical protein